MKQCQFIKGKPTADDKCKCGKPVVAEASYCAKHLAKCTIKRRRRTVEEAMAGVAYNIRRGRI